MTKTVTWNLKFIQSNKSVKICGKKSLSRYQFSHVYLNKIANCREGKEIILSETDKYENDH